MLLALLPMAIAGCKHDELVVPDDRQAFRLAGDFIQNNYDLSLFNAAVDAVGLKEELNGKGPYTLFVPGNTAFNEMGIRRPSDFAGMDKDSLKAALQYHILTRNLPVSEIPANGVDVRYANLAEREVYMTYATFPVDYPEFSRNNLFINGSFASKKDVALANGTLYVIDKVMKYTPGNVQQWLEAQPDYSVFVAGLKQFGLWSQLAGEGPFTIFAPHDSAFKKAGITMDTLPNLTTDKYVGERLFGIYVIPKKRYFITDFQAFNDIYSVGGIKHQLVAGDTTYFDLSGNKFGLQAASYSFAYIDPASPYDLPLRTVNGNISRRNDNLTDNGVIHHMSEVLIKLEDAKK